MKVLVVSSNRQRAQNTPRLAFPSGPAYISGAAREAGHEVEVFDACLVDDISGDLSREVVRFDPDVIAVSIRNLSTYLRSDFRQGRYYGHLEYNRHAYHGRARYVLELEGSGHGHHRRELVLIGTLIK